MIRHAVRPFAAFSKFPFCSSDTGDPVVRSSTEMSSSSTSPLSSSPITNSFHSVGSPIRFAAVPEYVYVFHDDLPLSSLAAHASGLLLSAPGFRSSSDDPPPSAAFGHGLSS